MLRYEPDANVTPSIAPRRSLRIVTVGQHAELRDQENHVRTAYAFAPGDIALLRPDGYLAALSHDEHSPALKEYIDRLVR